MDNAQKHNFIFYGFFIYTILTSNNINSINITYILAASPCMYLLIYETILQYNL
jgi:hypothetical protein